MARRPSSSEIGYLVSATSQSRSDIKDVFAGHYGVFDIGSLTEGANKS
jgi:hypothetical protein